MMFVKKLFLAFLTFFVIFSLSASYERPKLEFTYVKVKPGDTFFGLFQDKWEIVSRINKVDKYGLAPGMVLKVPLDWELAKKYPFFPEFLPEETETPKLILVVIQEQFLAGYEFGELKFWYPISSGMERGLTPDAVIDQQLRKEGRSSKDYATLRGRFKILLKKIAGRSSLYPVRANGKCGGYPMPFTLVYSNLGYAIHGIWCPQEIMDWFAETILNTKNSQQTKNAIIAELKNYLPTTMIGYPASHGCLRMFVKDAQQIFAWANINTEILIVSSFDDLKTKKAL